MSDMGDRPKCHGSALSSSLLTPQASVISLRRWEGKLVDRMNGWTHPVTIGTGARLFAEGTRSATWSVVKSRVGDAGVIIATYVPAGELVTGTIGG